MSLSSDGPDRSEAAGSTELLAISQPTVMSASSSSSVPTPVYDNITRLDLKHSSQYAKSSPAAYCLDGVSRMVS